MKRNPFLTTFTGFDGKPLQELGAEGRIRMVCGFDRAACENGLLTPHLQKTVRAAIQRRLRQLQRAKP